MNKWEEPEIKISAPFITVCFVGLLLITILGALVYFSSTEPPDIGVDEGSAKSIMIEQLTGLNFPPDIAKHANVTFSGTSVTIDTEKLNVWLGKNWNSK